MLLLNGLSVTLRVTFFAIIIGTVFGIVLALMKMSKSKVLSAISNLYITVIRGTPMVTQLLIIYFVVFASVNVSKIFVAIIAFGLNSSAYVAEIIRAGIQAVDRGQTEAGRSLGLSSRQTLFLIVMPQAVKNIFPAYVNEFIVLIKETAIVGYIALEDLTKAGDIIRSRTYEAFIPLLSVAFIYLIITSVLAKLCDIVERRLNRHDMR
ncbi:MAG TPA: amino acid ABC transporter permease [Clostridiales bacterium]|nr:amino acid ABC transporter permease [Clostridiales bacterium]